MRPWDFKGYLKNAKGGLGLALKILRDSKEIQGILKDFQRNSEGFLMRLALEPLGF